MEYHTSKSTARQPYTNSNETVTTKGVIQSHVL